MKRYFILFCFLLISSNIAVAVLPYQYRRDYRHDLIRQPPPPPIAEMPRNSPGVNYVWISGHWIWANEYRWQPGHWDQPPHPYASWLPGHWEQTTGGWIWVEGRWF